MKKLVFENLKELSNIEGKQLPVGEWYTVTQQMINDFANATLDKQWIHIDTAKAAKLFSNKNNNCTWIHICFYAVRTNF
ncbi:MaoC/PaaZ C-terminal domain-containing protein [Tenacibaculum singaporense]|uniref:MaoC/PaaZ C-terminal domain-containing protein n=1 Tax=Tenacibaculum singaporense TaxID=2358479 RepID=UPI001FCA17F9|nr:MaoC/PaaZ C-terminal domain-containing protein [Tenacibaculum singaporense]